MQIQLIIAIVIAVAAVGAWYFLVYKKKTAATTNTAPAPTSTGWIFQYSPNMPTNVPKDASGNYVIDFPSQDGVHYVVKKAPALAIGKVVSMVFSVSGTGQLIVVDPAGGTPKVTLYMQRKGDDGTAVGVMQQYRYWASPRIELAPGDFTLTAPIAADRWGDCQGKPGTDFQSQFIACVANAEAIGFTFGGYGAGHGLYAANGPVRFTLKSYTIA